ncbi:MAG: penicillin-binding transpeptidase domain-containing protein [Rikenellaceae bacterium]
MATFTGEDKEAVRKRAQGMLYFLLVVMLVIVVRIFWIQCNGTIAKNAERIERRIFRNHEIVAHRGSILTRNNEPLARSISMYQVEMDFGCEAFDSESSYRSNSDSLAKLLSAYFGDRSVAQYQKMFRDQRAAKFKIYNARDTSYIRSEGFFMLLLDKMRGIEIVHKRLGDTVRNHEPVALFPRLVDYTEWQTLKKYPILNGRMGLAYQRVDEENRVYTYDGLARRTIGAINNDRGQNYGIEDVYDDVLSGKNGVVRQQRIARGFYGNVPDENNRDAVAGLDVVTTIDAEIQDIAHSALQSRLQKTNARWGTTVVMEVATGDILAIANLDRVGSGENRRYVEQQNRAIGARSEPGSTMKLATAMALLEVAKMPTTEVYDSGDGKRVKVGRTDAQDSHSGYGEVALDVAFAQSLNGYFAKAIYENFKEDTKPYTSFLKDSLRLSKSVGFSKFGEPEPLIYDSSDGVDSNGKLRWTPHVTVVKMAQGYGMEFTPLQVLTFYNGFANEGRVVAPRLVSELRNSDGVTEKKYGVRVLVDQMCSRPTYDSLKRYLVEVNRSGTGAYWLGKFDGFEVAAKTGTAQFAQGGISHRDGHYVASMVGFMPANKPKYSVITTVYLSRAETTGGSYYGSTMAGEVMRNVMQQLFNKEQKWQAKLDTIAPLHRIDSAEVARVLERRAVVETSAGVEKDDEAVVSTLVEVPYIYGLGLRDAHFLLESEGLKVKVVGGAGTVFRQNHRAGTKVKRGTTIEITLR